MVLAIDVGNTNIVIGVFDGDKLCFIARMASDQNRTSDETAVQLKAVLSIYDINISLIDGAIVSSVVPMITEPLSNAIKILIGKKPLVVGPGMKTGINISIDNPAQLGSDLLVDSVAASALYPKPLIVADMGTATTLTVVNDKNSIIGGAILPGVKTSLNALTSNTAQLQQISIEAPKKAIGSNTVDCMRSGTVLGNASLGGDTNTMIVSIKALLDCSDLMVRDSSSGTKSVQTNARKKDANGAYIPDLNTYDNKINIPSNTDVGSECWACAEVGDPLYLDAIKIKGEVDAELSMLQAYKTCAICENPETSFSRQARQRSSKCDYEVNDY